MKQLHVDTATATPGGEAPDRDLMIPTVEAVAAAGRRLRRLFTGQARADSPDEVLVGIRANDKSSLALLRPALERARPGAGWVEDELGSGTLPDGEWWVVDPVEGNINHLQGIPDWGVTATLIRDNKAVLTAVHLPITGETYTAVRGHGAWVNGRALQVSARTELSVAIVGTSQARPDESNEHHRRMGTSIAAMMDAALGVRVSVPATLHLLNVATGRMDAFWQHSVVRADLLAGALLVCEAGGSVTDLSGAPWSITSTDFLAAAPGVAQAARSTLSATEGSGARCDERRQ